MSHIPKILNALSRLISYPDDSTVQTAELLYVVLHGELVDAAGEIAKFGEFAEQHDVSALEEAFAETFDVNPTCALEVGWHLFGEDYARGMFLVRMREELRKYDIAESIELPDHLSHVLAIVAAMPETEAERFVHACVQPAVDKMNQALAARETPYRHVVNCLASILKYTWGESDTANDRMSLNSTGSRPFETDRLHAYPVADVGCDCHSECAGSPEVVPLQIGRTMRSDNSHPASHIPENLK